MVKKYLGIEQIQVDSSPESHLGKIRICVSLISAPTRLAKAPDVMGFVFFCFFRARFLSSSLVNATLREKASEKKGNHHEIPSCRAYFQPSELN